MSQLIYKFWMAKRKEAWFQLSQEQQDEYGAKLDAAFKLAGGVRTHYLNTTWSTDEWQAVGVEQFPSLQAVQEFHQALLALNHSRYFEARSYLGTDFPAE